MGLYYGMGDREPHSDAFRFRGKEWLEDAVCQPRLDSWSRILNLDQNTISVLCRPDQNFPPPACGRARCFNRVHDQVNQYLLQLAPGRRARVADQMPVRYVTRHGFA